MTSQVCGSGGLLRAYRSVPMVTDESIRAVSDAIARSFSPERIVLFGSHAYGSPRDDSDVDILVVMPYEGNSLQKAAEIVRRVRPPFSLDLVVRAPAELRQRLAWEDPFLRHIVEKGRVLYASAHGGVGSQG